MNKYGFTGRWFVSFISTILGFIIGIKLAQYFTEIYYYLTLVLVAFLLCGICLKIYDKLEGK